MLAFSWWGFSTGIFQRISEYFRYPCKMRFSFFIANRLFLSSRIWQLSSHNCLRDTSEELISCGKMVTFCARDDKELSIDNNPSWLVVIDVLSGNITVGSLMLRKLSKRFVSSGLQ